MSKKLRKEIANYELTPLVEHFLANSKSIDNLKKQLNKDGMTPLIHEGIHTGYIINKNIK